MNNAQNSRKETVLLMGISEFWSGDLGLTLLTISLAVLIFVVTPLREGGIRGRIFFELFIVILMIFAVLSMKDRRVVTVITIAFVLVSGTFLAFARFNPSPFNQRLGSVVTTITLLLYVRIVLLVMFRVGPVTWSRMQGGICAYMLLGLAWASACQTLEEFQPGSFTFVTQPADFDQLIAKMVYFSFSTLTTLGSAVTPVTPFARSLTIAEALVGQLFPAILIGALVAMAMQARPKP